MNAKPTAAIRRRLLAEQDRIVGEWKRHGGDTGPGDGWNLKDLEERATLATTEAVERRITADDLQLLRKVHLALLRLTDGSYWQCARCHQTIPLDRLLAKPAVSLCLACQQLKDAAKSE